MTDKHKSDQEHALDQFENLLRQVLDLLEWSKLDPNRRWLLGCFMNYAQRFMRLGEIARDKDNIDVVGILAKFIWHVQEVDPGSDERSGVHEAVGYIFRDDSVGRRRRLDLHQLAAFLYTLGFDPAGQAAQTAFRLLNRHLTIPGSNPKLGDGKPPT